MEGLVHGGAYFRNFTVLHLSTEYRFIQWIILSTFQTAGSCILALATWLLQRRVKELGTTGKTLQFKLLCLHRTLLLIG